MRRIHPSILDNPDIERAYAYPAGRPWLRLNMVSSADGAAWLKGRTAGLSSKGDRRIFGLLRGLADVVVAGAGTVRTEQYAAIEPRESWKTLRADRAATPPIAVVTRSLDLDLDGPLFVGGATRSIVITCDAAPADRRAQASRVADVIVAGDVEVDMAEAVRELHHRGLTRILCEGGPRLNGHLAQADLVDELCLTISPMLLAGGAARIVNGEITEIGLALSQVLEEEGVLFCKYTRESSP